jgi:hypothetical protein
MPSTPDDLSISAARADALFASPLQRSDEPSAQQVRQAIAAGIGAVGPHCEASTSCHSPPFRLMLLPLATPGVVSAM